MNPPKADELDYVHFLIAAQKVFTCTEAARSAPEKLDPPAHRRSLASSEESPPTPGPLGRGENAGRA
jgi:putative transposase